MLIAAYASAAPADGAGAATRRSAQTVDHKYRFNTPFKPLDEND